MPGEVWREVPGYETLYEVSDSCRIRNCSTGKVLTPDVDATGRGRVYLYKDKVRKRHYPYRLMLEAFVGPCPAGKEACHRNDDPSDNRLENLYWGTRSENMVDLVTNGRAYQTTVTQCPKGHEYTPGNTRITTTTRNGRPSRICIECARASGRASERKRRERRLSSQTSHPVPGEDTAGGR